MRRKKVKINPYYKMKASEGDFFFVKDTSLHK